MAVECLDDTCPQCVSKTSELAPLYADEDIITVVGCDECLILRERQDGAARRLGIIERPY